MRRSLERYVHAFQADLSVRSALSKKRKEGKQQAALSTAECGEKLFVSLRDVIAEMLPAADEGSGGFRAILISACIKSARFNVCACSSSRRRTARRPLFDRIAVVARPIIMKFLAN